MVKSTVVALLGDGDAFGEEVGANPVGEGLLDMVVEGVGEADEAAPDGLTETISATLELPSYITPIF